MITIKNVHTPGGAVTDLFVRSTTPLAIDAQEHLLSLPTLVSLNHDCSILSDQNNNWEGWALTLLQSGIGAIFSSLPLPPQGAQAHIDLINKRLESAGIPLNIYFFADGTNPSFFDAIGQTKACFKGIKTSAHLANISLNPPFGNALERIFQIGAQEDLIITLDLLQGDSQEDPLSQNTLKTAALAIALTEKYSAQLCLQHIRTQEEVELVKDAKHRNLLVYGTVSYFHLFQNNNDQLALWDAVNQGVIDMVDDRGPTASSPQDASLLARFWLPVLLTAYREKKWSLDTLISVTRANAENIFCLPSNENLVLVDINKEITQKKLTSYPITDPFLHSLYSRPIIGWPAHVIAQGKLF